MYGRYAYFCQKSISLSDTKFDYGCLLTVKTCSRVANQYVMHYWQLYLLFGNVNVYCVQFIKAKDIYSIFFDIFVSVKD